MFNGETNVKYILKGMGMSHKRKIVIDEIDVQILFLLRANSRVSFSDIARSIGFSDVAIKHRIDKLIERKIIQKFTIVVSPLLELKLKLYEFKELTTASVYNAKSIEVDQS